MEKGMTGQSRGISNYNKYDKNSDELYKKLFDILMKSNTKFYTDKKRYGAFAKRKIYLAGPWFSEKANTLYDIVKTIFDNANSLAGCNLDVYYPKEEINETPLQAFMGNVKHIENCDTLIALIDEKDVGTAWEIGMAYSLNKSIILLGLDESSFLSHTNVMLAFTGQCMTLDNLADELLGRTHQYVSIQNCWEGIE